MFSLLYENYPLVIFFSLALLKGVFEYAAYKRQAHGEKQSSWGISVFFIVYGFATPVLIFCEMFFMRHKINPVLSFVFAFIYLILLILRIVSIFTLGKFYSVNVRISKDHELIKKGIYKYFRHPIYLIAIIENIFYPIASSAYFTCIILFCICTPVILLRRNAEQKELIKKFGKEYLNYMKKTIF